MCKKKMSYKKCYCCSHCTEYTNHRNAGLILYCSITGDTIEIKKCPVN